ncbi:MAG: type II toxin-antitoxin system Phd/YefM family antitoxin, partial [Isosphaeraceae bacterium]
MESVGSFEAKTHLPQLLERVAQGEEFTITKHGKPVARLAPAVPAKPKADGWLRGVRSFFRFLRVPYRGPRA